jgi:AcrR family transcriptional regulator
MLHLVNMRSDAVRNKTRILEAARELVAVQGPDVSMEAIAGLAGVAVGTLYRHHPTKAALLTAVVADSAERLASDAEEALQRARSGGDAAQELLSLLREFAVEFAADQAVKAAAESLGASVPHDPASFEPGSAQRRAVDAIGALLQRAQRAGGIRPDVSMADLMVLLAAVPGPDVPVAQRERFVDVMVTGLQSGDR